MSQVRVRNIEYALTGSISTKTGGLIKWRLEPNTWTDVADEVFNQIYSKYGEPKYSEAPNALPGKDGQYYGQPGQTRAELVNGQFLIEFKRS